MPTGASNSSPDSSPIPVRRHQFDDTRSNTRLGSLSTPPSDTLVGRLATFALPARTDPLTVAKSRHQAARKWRREEPGLVATPCKERLKSSFSAVKGA
jgi:hypothetical protein